MAIYNGIMKANAWFSTQFNALVSQQIESVGVSDLGGIYESRRIDAPTTGGAKTFTFMDVLKTYEFGVDGTSYNLLTKLKGPEPKTYVIEWFLARQIPLTTEEYYTRQIWLGEDAMNEFNSRMVGMLNTTRNVYEHTLFTSKLMVTAEENATSLGTISLVAPSNISGYDLLVWRAQELFRQLDDYFAELKEPSRDYTDSGFLTNFTESDFDIVVPLGVISSVRKHDVPFLFNPDSKYEVKEIHWKYFGTKNATAGTTGAANKTVRALVEKDYGTSPNIVHVFPGDLLPNSTDYLANETYTAKYESRPSINQEIDVYLLHKRDLPIMSAINVATGFFNPNTLHTQNYLTFGYNEIEDSHIGGYPLLKLSTDVEE